MNIIRCYERIDEVESNGDGSIRYLVHPNFVMLSSPENVAEYLFGLLKDEGVSEVVCYRASVGKIRGVEGKELEKLLEGTPFMKITSESSYVFGATGDFDDFLKMQDWLIKLFSKP